MANKTQDKAVSTSMHKLVLKTVTIGYNKRLQHFNYFDVLEQSRRLLSHFTEPSMILC
jgi:hypothetical protein